MSAWLTFAVFGVAFPVALSGLFFFFGEYVTEGRVGPRATRIWFAKRGISTLRRYADKPHLGLSQIGLDLARLMGAGFITMAGSGALSMAALTAPSVNLRNMAFQLAWSLLMAGLFAVILFWHFIAARVSMLRNAPEELRKLTEHLAWLEQEAANHYPPHRRPNDDMTRDPE